MNRTNGTVNRRSKEYLDKLVSGGFSNVNEEEKSSTEEEKSSTSVANRRSKEYLDKLVETSFYKRDIGFDTLASDIKSLTPKIEPIFSGWQSKENMNNTLKSVKGMHRRLQMYEEYRTKYGDDSFTDLSELYSSYGQLIDNWDSIASVYGKYDSAESYNNEKAKLDELSSMSAAQVKRHLDDKNQVAYTAVDGSEFRWSDLYSSKLLEEIKQVPGFEDSINKGKNIKNPTASEAQGYFKIGSNRLGAKEVKNVLEFAKEHEFEMTMAMANGETDFPVDLAYTMATQTERDIYNYMLGQEQEGQLSKGAAQKYLDTIFDTLKERYENKEIEVARTLGEEYPIIASGMSLFSNILSAGESIHDGINYLKTGEMDTNQFANLTSAFRSGVSQQYDWNVGGYDVFDFVYNTAMSAGDSVVSTTLLGSTGGAATLGLSAAGSATNDALERGMDDGNAFMTGLTSGVFEGLFERYSIGKFKSLKDAPVDGVKSYIKQVGKSMLVNASEETLTELANVTYDLVANGDFSQYKIDVKAYMDKGMSESEAKKKAAWNQAGRVVEAGASGALMGIGFGTVGSTSSYRNNSAIGSNIKANERVGDVFDLASASPEISSAYEAYTKYAEQGINTDNISDAQLGNLWTRARIDAQDTVDSKKSTAEEKATANQRIGDLKTYAQDNASATRMSKKAIKKVYGKDAESVDALIAEGLETSKDSESYKLATEYKAKIESGKMLTTNEISNLIEANERTFKAEDSNRVSKELEELGESSDIADVVARKIRGEIITTKEAEKLNASEKALQVLAENGNEQVTDFVKDMDKADANLFMALYDGKTDIEAYANDFNLVSEYSDKGYTAEWILDKKGVLSTEQATEIYKEKRIKADRVVSDKILALNAKMASSRPYKGFVNDSVIDYKNTSAKGKVNWNRLTPKQRQTVTFMKGFAQATGLNLVIEHNAKSKYNGNYNVDNNTITIDIARYADASRATKEAIIPALSHELTHWMEKKSPELWREMNELVFSTLKKSGRLSEGDRIANEIARQKEKYGRTLTEEQARSEIIARACEDMLSMSEEAQKMFNSLPKAEQKALVDKIKDIIQKLKDWVKELLSSYKSTSLEAKALREFKDELNRLSKLWDKMLVSSVKTNQSLEKSGAFKHETGVEGDVKYSDRPFAEQVDAILSGEDAISTHLKISEHTPKILLDLGLSDKPLLITSVHTKSAVGYEVKGKNIHYVDKDVFKSLPKLVENPAMVMESTKQGSIVMFVNAVDVNKNPVLCSIKINGTGFYNNVELESNVVTSVYGKDTNPVGFVEKAVDENRLLYWDKKMSQKLFDIPGLQLPDNIYNLDSNTIIRKIGENVNTKISSMDSIGRELSKGQQEYFKDSTVRDNDGSLKVMYRGDSSEFTVFDRKKTSHANLYGRGFYFTDSKAHATQYGDVREFYLDIKNPLSPNQNVITKKQLLNFLKAIENDGEDYDLYNYGEGATAESVLNSVWGKNDFEMLQDISASAVGDLVAAVELFNEVNGTTYDGIVLPTETVTFNSEQAKLTSNLNPTKDKDILFSMRENVEETKELVAVHNMQVSELERTLDLGGLPMPSIAIIKAKSGHSEYGDVSLVFPKSTIDPKTNKNNKVYGGDAWTPTYPTIEYKPNAKVADKISKKYYELSRKFGNDESRPLYNYVYDLEEQLNRHKGEIELINELYDDTKMMQLYLLDSGKSKIETIKKEVSTELTDAEVEMNEFFINELGANVVDEVMWDGNGTPMSYRKNYLSKYGDSIREAYKKLLSEVYQFTDEQVQTVLDTIKPVDLLRFMREAHKYRQNGRVTTKTEDDYTATEEAIRDAVGEGYRGWVDSLFKGIEEKSGIRNNVDYFTNSGNRRSWEALHWENNLENVVKVMKSQDNGVAAIFSGHAIWAVSAKDYRSVDEMKADSDRLKRLSEEEYNEIKEGFGTRFQEIAESIMSKTESNPFIAADNAMECIIEAVRNSKTKSGILKNLKEYPQLTVTETTVDDIVSLVTDISNMPTEYFEAKPKRAVGLNEIATAIIPDATNESTKTRLNDMGIKFVEYESGNEQSRLDALNSLDNVMFSDRDTGVEVIERDSDGNTLTESQQEFFKDSKVRDDNGNLLVCYHGTYEDFTVFDILKTSSANVFGKGHYFTSKKTDAQDNYASGEGADVHTKIEALAWFYFEEMGYTEADYESNDAVIEWNEAYDKAEEFYNKGRVVEAYLNIKNPVYAQGSELYDSNGNFVSARSAEYLKELGYDGIIDYGVSEKFGHFQELDADTVHYVVFDSNQIKLTSNTNPTSDPDVRYSDREDTSVYDLMGENERLLKENEKFKAEVERLNERLKIERKVTNGNFFNENQLGAAAGHLRNISKSLIAKDKLVEQLKGVYSFIAHSPELTWEEVFERCYNIADAMLEEAKPEIVVDDYSKRILNEIRTTKISLDKEQKKEAEYIFGKNWNRHFFNRVGISDNGIPIDMQWQEWSSLYPDIFEPGISDGDMIGELDNVINTLRDASETVMEYNEEERKRWLAREIYNQYWNVSPIRTTADKYDRQIRRLNFEHRRIMTEFREEYNSRMKDKLKAEKDSMKEKHKKLVEKIRERKEKEIAVAKERGKEKLNQYKENAERKTRIQSITSNALSLNEMLVKNSKDKHIPEVMKDTVIELLQAINFSSKRLLEKGVPTNKDMRLANALRNLNKEFLEQKSGIKEALDDFYASEIDKKTAELVESVDKIMDNIGDNEFILNKMSAKDLKTLDSVIKIVKGAVNRVNKFHVAQHNAGVESLAIQSTQELKSRKKAYNDNKKHFDKLKTDTYWKNLNPYYAFKNLGEGAQIMFNALQDGQDKIAFLSKEVIDFAESVYTDKEYKKWSKTFFDFKVMQNNGEVKKFSMNVPQIMSLYCVAKQEDAKRHLLHGNEEGYGGGITIVETDKTEAVRNNIMLTEADLNSIISKLDDKAKVGNAKAVADKLQEFMGTRGAELGNEISMARWGIKSFGIKDYFPIKVSDGAVPEKGETPGVQGNPLIALLNMSFTHSRNEFASQSIEIGDVFDVFASHMSSMIQYNAMALPVLDMYKWMNCHGKNEDGTEFSVKTSVKDTFGDYAWGYLNTFMKDVNGTTKDITRDKLGMKFFRNAKVAKVAFNIRVVALQFTSYIRAGSVIDNKYLLKALMHTPKIKKSEQYCGMALLKSLGYYDTDITKPLTDKIKHVTSAKEKVIDWSLKGAEVADKVTLGYLWNACELEVRQTRKDLRVGSAEFYKEIGLRLREVIYRTQVVDSQLTRSQMMRGSAWDKMLTSFASENALSFNLITDIYVSNKLDKRSLGKEEARKKNGKYMRKAITAYVVTNLVTAAIASMFDAFRDYDEEDKDEEYIATLMVENFVNNVSFVNKIPYINLITSALSGFGASRLDADWMEETTKALKEISKIASGSKYGDVEDLIKYSLKAGSDVSGIAAYNIYRDINAIIEMLND